MTVGTTTVAPATSSGTTLLAGHAYLPALPSPGMTDRRGLLGGLCLLLGAAPLVVVYGTHPLGYLGLALAAFGLAVSYGAYNVE